jgi:hypothetical protein
VSKLQQLVGAGNLGQRGDAKWSRTRARPVDGREQALATVECVTVVEGGKRAVGPPVVADKLTALDENLLDLKRLVTVVGYGHPEREDLVPCRLLSLT